MDTMELNKLIKNNSEVLEQSGANLKLPNYKIDGAMAANPVLVTPTKQVYHQISQTSDIGEDQKIKVDNTNFKEIMEEKKPTLNQVGIPNFEENGIKSNQTRRSRRKNNST